MKTLLIMIGLLLTIASNAQLTSERKLHIKTLDSKNIDTYVTWTGQYKAKSSAFSFTIGYGRTLAGNGWVQPKNSWGNVPFGSGMVNSPMYQAHLAAGPEYTKDIHDMSWGRNGLGFMLNGNVGKFNLIGAYSGYSGLSSFSFSGTEGTFTGRGIFILKDNKVEQARTDLEFKF